MKQRIYIDTSVIGGKFDIEFEFYTDLFFKEISKNGTILLVSDILESELLFAPEKVKEFYATISSDNLETVILNEEAIELAEKYLEEGVVGQTSRSDCRHIALATIYKADVLVSWNFKHIVNLKRIKGYNSVNLREGYITIEIRSPKELIEI